MAVGIIALLIISAGVVLFARRDKEAFLLAALNLTLAQFWFMMLVYISKKGGFGHSILQMLYGSREVRTWFQYLLFTLGEMGYIMAVGRYLFPLLALWLALYYCQRVNVHKRPWLFGAAALLPMLSMIIYYPPVFEWFSGLNKSMVMVLVNASLFWIVCYLLLTLLLLALELHDTTMRFYKRQFAGRIMMTVGLMVLYTLYCPQDPAQVYLFYRNEYMGAQQGLWYLSPALNPVMYSTVFTLVIVSSAAGVLCVIRYARESILEGQEERAIRRKFDATSKGASVFVHSVKNQLLANRVLLKRIGGQLKSEELNMDMLREYHRQLVQNNEYMVERMEELYRGIRTNSIALVGQNLRQVCQLAASRMKKKYPDALVELIISDSIVVLCDRSHFSQALYNLMINGWEAQMMAKRENEPVVVEARQERLWTVIEVRDKGYGMSQAQRRHIFEPFWSSKNANYNWGMGLYYVRQIVKSHLGVLRVETKLGQGTTFSVQLPKYNPVDR